MISKDSRMSVEAFTYDKARHRHISTAECQSVMKKEEDATIRVAYERDAVGLESEKAGFLLMAQEQCFFRG